MPAVGIKRNKVAGVRKQFNDGYDVNRNVRPLNMRF